MYAFTVGTIRGSSLVTGFDQDALFISALSWLTSLTFSWTPYLTGTLGGTAEGLDFLDLFAKIFNTSFC